MGCRRGEIRLANFNPSKSTAAGKVRPCLVIRGDLLNEADHPSTTVIPLTTQVTPAAAPLRLKIQSRDRLLEDSDLMIDQVRTIDNRRLTGDVLATLTNRAMLRVSEYLKLILEL